MLRDITIISIVLSMFAFPALAQMVCGERDKFLRHLGKNFSEAPVAIGLVSDCTILEVLASIEGKWTILITNPKGLTCFVTSGEAWENIEHHLALGPDT